MTDSEPSTPSSPVYSFKDVTKDENGKWETEVIRYGEIQHSTILEIFGHLMFYDDLKFYARREDDTTYFTAKYEWSENECYFSVFTDTDHSDEYDKLFFRQAFNRHAMSMEPFITLGQIERGLELEEEEARSVAESSTESSIPASPATPQFKENHCQLKTCLKPFPQDEVDGKFICELATQSFEGTTKSCFICLECVAIYGTTHIDSNLLVE
jgi:hypothetical protein